MMPAGHNVRMEVSVLCREWIVTAQTPDSKELNVTQVCMSIYYIHVAMNNTTLKKRHIVQYYYNNKLHGCIYSIILINLG